MNILFHREPGPEACEAATFDIYSLLGRAPDEAQAVADNHLLEHGPDGCDFEGFKQALAGIAKKLGGLTVK